MIIKPRELSTSLTISDLLSQNYLVKRTITKNFFAVINGFPIKTGFRFHCLVKSLVCIWNCKSNRKRFCLFMGAKKEAQWKGIDKHFRGRDKLRFWFSKWKARKENQRNSNIQIRDDDPLMMDHKKISKDIVGNENADPCWGMVGSREEKSLTHRYTRLATELKVRFGLLDNEKNREARSVRNVLDTWRHITLWDIEQIKLGGGRDVGEMSRIF